MALEASSFIADGRVEYIRSQSKPGKGYSLFYGRVEVFRIILYLNIAYKSSPMLLKDAPYMLNWITTWIV